MVMWSNLPKEALDDCFRPPAEPVMVRCLHCGGEYWSSEIVWEAGDEGGFWRCPVEGCNGAGFEFDIFPIDSQLWGDDEEDDEDDEEWMDGEELTDEDSADL